MILVDSPIWIDHIRAPVPELVELLGRDDVAIHAFVIGEVALGSIRNRQAVLQQLTRLPKAPAAFDIEVLDFIERHHLHGTGIGYVDTHLLVSTRLGKDLRLWTRDRRLDAAARRLDVAYGDGPAS